MSIDEATKLWFMHGTKFFNNESGSDFNAKTSFYSLIPVLQEFVLKNWLAVVALCF